MESNKNQPTERSTSQADTIADLDTITKFRESKSLPAIHPTKWFLSRIETAVALSLEDLENPPAMIRGNKFYYGILNVIKGARERYGK